MAAETTKAPLKSSTDRWENEGGPSPVIGSPPRDDLQSVLKELGITPVQLTVFDWGGYRYSNSRDAIAAAKRAIKNGAS